MIIGCDLGNKSINGLALMDDSLKLIEYRYILYDKMPIYHRRDILSVIDEWYKYYCIRDNTETYLLFEKINLYVGGHISKLNNIISLAYIQATLINEFSEKMNISQVNVQTWKSDILGSKTATKDDAIAYVQKEYPDIDLRVTIEHKRKDNEIILCHDLADAVCIARFGALNKDYMKANNLNYQ